MHVALAMFATDYTIRPDELAKAAEERNFEALFFPEHTHIPTSRKTPTPRARGLPKDYWHTHDLFVGLAMAAAVTQKIKLGTGICLVIERDPIILAKEVASLDFLSGGRVLFGIEAGWAIEEMANHVTEYKSRWRLMRDRVQACKAIWTQEEASFHGEFVNFEPIWSYPKPVQKPHPPVLLGGHGEHALKRVVDYCDGWMPIGQLAADFGAEVAQLNRLAQEAGRDPASISKTIFFAPADRKKWDEYASHGVERVILPVPAAGRDQDSAHTRPLRQSVRLTVACLGLLAVSAQAEELPMEASWPAASRRYPGPGAGGPAGYGAIHAASDALHGSARNGGGRGLPGPGRIPQRIWPARPGDRTGGPGHGLSDRLAVQAYRLHGGGLAGEVRDGEMGRPGGQIHPGLCPVRPLGHRPRQPGRPLFPP